MPIEPRHVRAIIGVLLMILAVVGYAATLFHVGAPPEPCPVTWMQLVRQYGFPGALLLGGYNLFQPGALAEIMSAWRTRSP